MFSKYFKNLFDLYFFLHILARLLQNIFICQNSPNLNKFYLEFTQNYLKIFSKFYSKFGYFQFQPRTPYGDSTSIPNLRKRIITFTPPRIVWFWIEQISTLMALWDWVIESQEMSTLSCK